MWIHNFSFYRSVCLSFSLSLLVCLYLSLSLTHTHTPHNIPLQNLVNVHEQNTYTALTFPLYLIFDSLNLRANALALVKFILLKPGVRSGINVIITNFNVLPIFGQTIGVLLNYHYYDPILHRLVVFRLKKPSSLKPYTPMFFVWTLLKSKCNYTLHITYMHCIFFHCSFVQLL